MASTFLLTIGNNATFKKLFNACPWTHRLVKHFVPGDTWVDARVAISALLEKGLKATVAFLGGCVRTPAQAEAMASTYSAILDHIGTQGWAGDVEVSVDLESLGLLLRDGGDIALAHAMALAEKARGVGSTITIGSQNPAAMTKTLKIVQSVREVYPETGCVVQACVKRTEADCRSVGTMRVRLVKGTHASGAHGTYADAHDIDLSYVRCLKTLMESDGTPLVATHDPIMIEIAQELAAHTNHGLRDFEFQMLYGSRVVEQERLVDLGHTVRVYVPFGHDWYQYVISRLAAHPGAFFLFVRSLFGQP